MRKLIAIFTLPLVLALAIGAVGCDIVQRLESTITPIPVLTSTLLPPSTPVHTPPPTPTLTTTEGTLPQLQVHYIDVGQGDSILLDLGTTDVLIDGGDGHTDIVPYLQQYVHGDIEVMVATHSHSDHVGGLRAVLDAFKVDQVWTNGQGEDSLTYIDFAGKVNAENPDIEGARRGDTISAGSLTFKVLNPEASLPSDVNGNSIVLELDYGNVSFLFTGDAQKDSETSIIAAGEVHHVDILKVGHHGSRTSSSEEFLNVVKPEVAIYMAGLGNIYGHPHPETISALQSVGAQIYGTDTCGTITVTTDGSSYTVTTAKKRATTTSTPTPTITSPT